MGARAGACLRGPTMPTMCVAQSENILGFLHCASEAPVVQLWPTAGPPPNRSSNSGASLVASPSARCMILQGGAVAQGVCEGAGISLQCATTPPCPASVVARQKARGSRSVRSICCSPRSGIRDAVASPGMHPETDSTLQLVSFPATRSRSTEGAPSRVRL